MNLETMDVKKEFERYNQIAPVQTAHLSGGDFQYRYYKNPNPQVNVTMVVLAGGSGMGDGFFGVSRGMMERYSLISFNYPMAFKGNEATADAIAELVKTVGAENPYYWGQSYGGLLAQIIAKRHPEVVSGLILTSTASLSNDLKYSGMKNMLGMINEEKEKERDKKYRKIPMALLPPVMNLAFKAKLKGQPGTYKAVKEFMKQLKPSLTNEYFCHMNSLLGDLRNQIGTHYREDFDFLKGRVLIIEPDDDDTFTDDVKEALFRIMPDPVIVRRVEGGHLAIAFNPDKFLQIIYDFIDTQDLSD